MQAAGSRRQLQAASKSCQCNQCSPAPLANPLLLRRAASAAACTACREAGGAPLEELAASFARFFGAIDLEKLDVVVGFALAEILQAS